jgi:hypothetical protein
MKALSLKRQGSLSTLRHTILSKVVQVLKYVSIIQGEWKYSSTILDFGSR